MLEKVINFFSRNCKNQRHSDCEGNWSGLEFEFNCECTCHGKKNNAADWLGRPDSATSAHHLSEVTNRSGVSGGHQPDIAESGYRKED